MTAQNPKNERRKYGRAYVTTDLFFSVRYAPDVRMKVRGKAETGVMADLGEGGIAFVSGVEVARDTNLDVSFELEKQGGKSVKIKARGIVRYCFLQGDFESYRIGLEFTKITQTAKQAIAAFVKDVSGAV